MAYGAGWVAVASSRGSPARSVTRRLYREEVAVAYTPLRFGGSGAPAKGTGAVICGGAGGGGTRSPCPCLVCLCRPCPCRPCPCLDVALKPSTGLAQALIATRGVAPSAGFSPFLPLTSVLLPRRYHFGCCVRSGSRGTDGGRTYRTEARTLAPAC